MRALSTLVGVALSVGVTSSPAIAIASPATPHETAQIRLAQQMLSITVPSAANLGAAFTGTTLSGRLGAVTVEDHRIVNPNTWTATVSATSFRTGTGTPAQTIPNSQVSYWSGPATKSTGGGTLIPGQLTAAQAQSLTVSRTAFRKTAGSGNNTVTWTPTLLVAIPSTAVLGLYTATITHSVA